MDRFNFLSIKTKRTALNDMVYGSNFRFGEGTGTVASPLVLQRDAQDVWKRFYTGEDTDAVA